MGERFENSEAWKAARELTNAVYSLCSRGPLAKDSGLRDQLQRAAVSAMNKVAEGWESLQLAEKRQAFNIARRSYGEARSMTYVLLDNKFISVTELTNLPINCIRGCKLITGLVRSRDNQSPNLEPIAYSP